MVNRNTPISLVMPVAGRPELTSQAIHTALNNAHGIVWLTLVLEMGTKVEDLPGLPLENAGAQIIFNPLPKCIGAAKNAGVAYASKTFGRDSLLYLSDNDVWFAPGWDMQLKKAHVAYPDSFQIIGGGCHPFLQPNNKFNGWFYLDGKVYEVKSRDAVSGYSWLMSWETWDKYGPLDANAPGVRQSEDWAMCQRVIADGKFVGALTPEVVIHTGVTDSYGEKIPGWEEIQARVPEGVLYK